MSVQCNMLQEFS